jgi:hypothetical protein
MDRRCRPTVLFRQSCLSPMAFKQQQEVMHWILSSPCRKVGSQQPLMDEAILDGPT